MTNVFVVGLEPFNLGLLEAIPEVNDFNIVELLSADEAVEVEPDFSFNGLLDLSEQRIAERGPAHAIVNYWDFPGSCLAPVLCMRHGLPGPRIDALAALEHKYWARREMAQCIPEVTPRVSTVNPFANDPRSLIDLDYPFWIKPVVSHSSYLGFRVNDDDDLDLAISAMRDHIGHFGNPFDEFLELVNVPPALAGIGGCHCIAEEIISAEAQVTLEGYVCDGQVVTYGHIDSIRENPTQPSFARYEYPSQLPRAVLNRMDETIARFLAHIGYDDAPFNAEFFWNAADDRISLLEVNSRMSKSHCPLFQDVDGISHQKVTLDLALGREPDFPARRGRWPYAAKFMVRLFQDGEIRRVPSAAEIHHMQSRYPEAMVQILVKEGQRLSHMRFQDSYSFEIADIFVGGHDNAELVRKYADIMEILPFEVSLTASTTNEAS